SGAGTEPHCPRSGTGDTGSQRHRKTHGADAAGRTGMTSLATIIHARQVADKRNRCDRSHISDHERARIIDLLGRLPLPEVRRRTNRAYSTLAAIARTEGL